MVGGVSGYESFLEEIAELGAPENLGGATLNYAVELVIEGGGFDDFLEESVSVEEAEIAKAIAERAGFLVRL